MPIAGPARIKPPTRFALSLTPQPHVGQYVQTVFIRGETHFPSDFPFLTLPKNLFA
jgi:hypothetical protein